MLNKDEDVLIAHSSKIYYTLWLSMDADQSIMVYQSRFSRDLSIEYVTNGRAFGLANYLRKSYLVDF